jgi:multidrug resistance efflux pump
METALSDARRRVAEAKAQCEQQAELLEAMEAQGSSPDAIDAAARMLDILDRVLALMRAHLQREEELQADRIVEPPQENL